MILILICHFTTEKPKNHTRQAEINKEEPSTSIIMHLRVYTKFQWDFSESQLVLRNYLGGEFHQDTIITNFQSLGKYNSPYQLKMFPTRPKIYWNFYCRDGYLIQKTENVSELDSVVFYYRSKRYLLWWFSFLRYSREIKV